VLIAGLAGSTILLLVVIADLLDYQRAAA